METLAYHAGVAIEKAKLIDAISDTAMQIIRLDENQFLQYIIDIILKLFKPHSSCTIWSYDKNQDCLNHKDVGLSHDPFKGYTGRSMAGVSGLAIRQKRAMVINDISKSPLYLYPEIAEEVGYKSLLSIPILISDHALGVFNVHTFEYHKFTKLEINLLSAFASYAAVVMEVSQALKAKSELISVFAHELRTPLNHIKFFMERWKRNENLAIDYRDQANMMLYAFERQQKLIDKVTTFSFLATPHDQSKLNVNFTSICLNDLLQSIINKFELSILDKSILLSFNQPEHEVCVNADLDKIERVLDNLLDNALKYTPHKGQVTVKLVEKLQKVYISVIDTGIGIPPEDLPHIFDEFYSGNSSKGLKGGMGIGLYIAKKLVEAHNGTVLVKSELGQGSQFMITLPAGMQETNRDLATVETQLYS